VFIRIAAVTLFAVVTAACSTAAPAAQAPDNAVNTTQTASARPNPEKLTRHLRDHVSYPASRGDVLAACADTLEFTAAEKQWTAKHLPEGDYATAEEAVQAMGI
jgi:hypothetical protein